MKVGENTIVIAAREELAKRAARQTEFPTEELAGAVAVAP